VSALAVPTHEARPLQRRCSCGGVPGPGGECAACRAKRLRRQESHRVLGPGEVLQAPVRTELEARFGHDFSDVRIHAGARANESAREAGAAAYTIGRDIVFGAGRYASGTPAGRRLLAHELAHVVQQDMGAPKTLQRQGEGDEDDGPLEQEARAAEGEVAGGESEAVELAGGKGAKAKPKPKPKTLSSADVRSHITANNQSTLSTELLLCLIWKESSFDPSLKSSGSTATGLMQVTKPAVNDVNRNTPKGIHFKHAEMTDPAKNIDCGTRYLQMRIDRAGDTKKGLEGFGTGSGYADNILVCETCLKGKSANEDACLHAIHS
jgi:soluble lytic murein transglycosylase-like protein